MSIHYKPRKKINKEDIGYLLKEKSWVFFKFHELILTPVYLRSFLIKQILDKLLNTGMNCLTAFRLTSSLKKKNQYQGNNKELRLRDHI